MTKLMIIPKNKEFDELINDSDAFLLGIENMSINMPIYFNIDEIDAISIAYEGLNERVVERVHKLGKEMFVWTVSNEEEGQRAIYLGVDNIITNDVIRIRSLINN